MWTSLLDLLSGLAQTLPDGMRLKRHFLPGVGSSKRNSHPHRWALAAMEKTSSKICSCLLMVGWAIASQHWSTSDLWGVPASGADFAVSRQPSKFTPSSKGGNVSQRCCRCSIFDPCLHFRTATQGTTGLVVLWPIYYRGLIIEIGIGAFCLLKCTSTNHR